MDCDMIGRDGIAAGFSNLGAAAPAVGICCGTIGRDGTCEHTSDISAATHIGSSITDAKNNSSDTPAASTVECRALVIVDRPEEDGAKERTSLERANTVTIAGDTVLIVLILLQTFRTILVERKAFGYDQIKRDGNVHTSPGKLTLF
mmetsp:Transcript_32535/g.64507  ORF Transcript_32535/g.64507 Transcript_32535/m.64507 type:complete len:147 (+) Transcript_32535:183-623(+)